MSLLTTHGPVELVDFKKFPGNEQIIGFQAAKQNPCRELS